jgi:hypothetical protein
MANLAGGVYTVGVWYAIQAGGRLNARAPKFTVLMDLVRTAFEGKPDRPYVQNE